MFTPIGPHVCVAILSGNETFEAPDGATHVRVQVTGGNVRYTTDGEEPDHAHGWWLGPASIHRIPVPSGVFRVANVTAAIGDPTINLQWGRED